MVPSQGHLNSAQEVNWHLSCYQPMTGLGCS